MDHQIEPQAGSKIPQGGFPGAGDSTPPLEGRSGAAGPAGDWLRRFAKAMGAERVVEIGPDRSQPAPAGEILLWKGPLPEAADLASDGWLGWVRGGGARILLTTGREQLRLEGVQRVSAVRIDDEDYTLWLLGGSMDVETCLERLGTSLSRTEEEQWRRFEVPALPDSPVLLTIDALWEEHNRFAVLPAGRGCVRPGENFTLDQRHLLLLQRCDDGATASQAEVQLSQALARRDPPLPQVLPELDFSWNGFSQLLDKLVRAGFLSCDKDAYIVAEDVEVDAWGRMQRRGEPLSVSLRACDALALSLVLEGEGARDAFIQAEEEHHRKLRRDARLFYWLAAFLGIVRIEGALTGDRAEARLLDQIGLDMANRSDLGDPLGLRHLYFEVVREDGWCARARREAAERRRREASTVGSIRETATA